MLEPSDWAAVRTIVRDMVLRGELDALIEARMKAGGGKAPPPSLPPARYDDGGYDAGSYG